MRTTIQIHFDSAQPTATRLGRAPFFPTYQLPYANEKKQFYSAPYFGAILQQYDAFDVYITVLEVKARQTDELPIAIPIETLQRDLHWVYQIKGTLAIDASAYGGGHRFELAAGRQTQVYSHGTKAMMYLAEQHTISVSIAVKAQWLIRYQPVEAKPVERLISFLKQRARLCVVAQDGLVEPAMPHLNELLSLPMLEGERMDAAIARPVSHLIRLARHPHTGRMPDPSTAFAATICRQVDNHIQSGNIPSIAELARQQGLSARWLSQRYRKACGHTLQAYIVRRRLEEGLRLMVEAHATVGEAALAIGYAETSVFSKQFKKQYGHAPREYLKKLDMLGDG